MRCRDFWIIVSSFLSLLFTVLIIIPGTNKGVLPGVAIVTFKYSINNTVVYSPPTVSCESWCESVFYDQYPDIHSFFFTVHYLSICSGFMGGSATAAYTLLECQNRKLGWTFHTHDPYIVNFGAANGSRPVSMDDVKAVKIETATPAATMVVGLTCSILAVIMYFIDLYGLGRHWQVDIPTGTAALMGVAATFLMLSSALITSEWHKGQWLSDGHDHYRNYTVAFIALSWCAMLFMYFAFVGKVVVNVWAKENARRMMRRGRI